MNMVLFIVVLLISLIVVRIGAIAFELTGLEWSLAKFQALSCFTGTGFTTKEAELIVSNRQRRRIASILMVLGNAGLVTLIATFANSLRPDTFMSSFSLPFLHMVLPSWLHPWVNLAVIILAVVVLARVTTHSRLMMKITNIVRNRIISHEIIKRVTFEELIVATGGYGVSNIKVCERSPVIGKALIDTELRKNDIMVLAVERNEEVIANPAADQQILLGDRLVCFGKLEKIRAYLCP